MRFTCTVCGEDHEGLPDLAFVAPFYYYTVPEAERTTRCLLTSDLCSIDDEDFFIRGCLEIPVLDRAETFTWGAWCSVSRSNFEKYRDVVDEPHQSRVGPFFGWFSVRLPGYPDTLKLKVMAHLRDDGLRPWFELEDSDHPLSIEYKQGITMNRLNQIHEAHLHAPEG